MNTVKERYYLRNKWIERETITVGEFRKLSEHIKSILGENPQGGSKINKSLTKKQAVDILLKNCYLDKKETDKIHFLSWRNIKREFSKEISKYNTGDLPKFKIFDDDETYPFNPHTDEAEGRMF